MDQIADNIQQLILSQRRNGLHDLGWQTIELGVCSLCGHRHADMVRLRAELAAVKELADAV